MEIEEIINIDNTIPVGWEVISLDDLVLKIFAGGDKPDEVSNEKTEDFSYPIFSNGLKDKGLYGYSNTYRVDEECITISARGTIGYTEVRTPKFTPIVRLIVIVPTEYTLSKYLKFYFENLIVEKSGTSIPQLTVPMIKPIPIKLPPLNEQKRIITKIEKLFSNLDNSDKYLLHLEKQLKRYRQSVLKSAFEGELTKEWRKKNKNVQDVQKLIDNIQIEKEELIRKKKINKQKSSYEIENNLILKSIPSSWVYCKLGKITNVVRGGSPRPAGDERFYNGNIPFLKVADLTKNDSMYVDGYTYSIKETGLKKTRYVEEEVLLLSNSGATLGVPKICTFPTAFNDGIAAFIHMNKYLSKSFFYYFLKSKTKWFLFEASQGQGQPNLNTDIISETIISLPSYEEQNEIVKQIEKHFSIIDKLEVVVQQSIKESKRLRQSILKQAFEGKLVEQDPNDESASVLLEKIAKAKEEYQKAQKKQVRKK